MLRLITLLSCLLASGSDSYAQLPPTPTKPIDDQPVPRMFVGKKIKVLGNVIEGDKVTVTWLLENHGDAPLVIDRTRASCGCTVVKLADDQKTIPPRGSLTLEAEFNSSGRRDLQNKAVTIFTNDPVEPATTLEFRAMVERLFEMKPAGTVNLRSIRRGQSATATLDIVPATGKKRIEVTAIAPEDPAVLAATSEFLKSKNGAGQRIRFVVPATAPVGPFRTSAEVSLRVDGVERQQVVRIWGQVVGPVVWTPKVVDASRHDSRPGKKLTPVTIRSSDDAALDIFEVSAGPLLDAQVEPIGQKQKRTAYRVILTVRDGVPAGPFAAELNVETSSLDQPLVRVPVFGIVAPVVAIDPPIVLFRQDGTLPGSRRRLKLQTAPGAALNLKAISCDHPNVQAVIDAESSAPYNHVRFLDVRLTGEVPPGRQEAVLAIETDVAGAERLEIPVVIHAP